MSNGEEGLYQLLEKILFEANEPLDAVQIYDMPEVRKLAASANRLTMQIEMPELTIIKQKKK